MSEKLKIITPKQGGNREIKIKIQGQDDRREIAAILADNGYKVRIEEVELPLYEYDYFVCVGV